MVRIVLCALALLVCATEASAQAQTPDAKGVDKVKLPPTDEPLVVHHLDLVGVDSLPAGILKDALATHGSSWLPWVDDPPFDVNAFKEDLQRIVAYYSERGYRQARIASYDVNVTPDRKGVDITIHVDEGKPTLVSNFVFEGFEPVQKELDQQQKDGLPIAVKAPVAREPVFATIQRLTTLLKNHGYAYAKVEVMEESVGPESIRLRFKAEPGVQALFGPIEITGQRSVSASVVRRQLTYRPGDLYRHDRLLESQQRLYALELFEFASIEVVDEEKQPAAVATRVTVAEGKHRTLDLTAGYGSEERLRGEASWKHANLFGGARSFSIHGKASALEEGGEVGFTNPSFYHPDLRFDANGHGWFQDEPAYRLLSRGGGFGLSHALTKRSSVRVALDGEYTSSSISNAALADLTFRPTLISLGLDPTTGSQRGLLSTVSISTLRNTADSLLDPRHGSFMSLTLEEAGGVLPGKYNYTKVAAEGRRYVSIGQRAWVALRMRWTTIHPSNGPSDVPFFKRLFLGGASSLRGWGRYEVAPLSGSGLPIGGLSSLESTGELRFLATEHLIAAVFLDAGNVWSNVGRLLPRQLRYDAGPGLRYLTPIGPVRIDLAYQLTPISGLLINGAPEVRHWRVHVGIGQSF